MKINLRIISAILCLIAITGCKKDEVIEPEVEDTADAEEFMSNISSIYFETIYIDVIEVDCNTQSEFYFDLSINKVGVDKNEIDGNLYYMCPRGAGIPVRISYVERISFSSQVITLQVLSTGFMYKFRCVLYHDSTYRNVLGMFLEGMDSSDLNPNSQLVDYLDGHTFNMEKK